MTDKEKLHQTLSSLWKNDDSVGKIYYNQALLDVQTAIDLQEEPASEELEEAAIEYAATGEILSNGKEMISFDEEKAFKAGAKWQKEQMIKKAFPAEIGRQRSDYKCMLNGNFSTCNTGDKVKLIIIKED